MARACQSRVVVELFVAAHRALARAGFEYAVEGKASRCKLFKGPILSTLPVGGASCYKKASKTELGPHKKRL